MSKKLNYFLFVLSSAALNQAKIRPNIILTRAPSAEADLGSWAAGNSLGDLHNGGGQSSVPRFTRVHTGVHTRVHAGGVHAMVQKGTLGYTKGSP